MWTSLKALPLMWKLIGVGLAALAIVAAFKSCTAVTNHSTDAAVAAGEQKGAATAAASAATKGLSNVEEGNKAAAAVARDGDARRAGCLRHSRTPENCQ